MPDVVIGIDFAGPAAARGQRRKILAVAAERTGRLRFAVRGAGFNARLLGRVPGWTAEELARTLAMAPVPAVVAADFPFCVPLELLERPAFAAAIGHPRPFGTWRAFHTAVARRLTLGCPADYGPFRRWRRRAYWLKRDVDRAAGAQPALKHQFQVLFNMTLLGCAFLAELQRSGRFDVVPFQSRGRAQVIEVYPGHALRTLGVRTYKREPRRAIDAMARRLAARGITLELDPRVRAACEAYDTGGASPDHDAADALVAACIGVLHRVGAARPIAAEGAAAAGPDGAIWSV
jgi:hypothetical protein